MRAVRPPLLACLALAVVLAGHGAAGIRVVKGKHAPYRIVSPHFVVEFSVSPSDGKEYAVLCEKGYKRLASIFHVSPRSDVWRGKCRVYLFKTRDEFVQFAQNVHRSATGMMSGGYTRITSRDPDIVLFLHNNDHVKLQQTVVHEMTHVFLQLFDKSVRIPTWVHEGCAQFFEFMHYPKQSRLAASKRLAKRMVKDSTYYPFRDLFKLHFPPTDAKGYAQSWSMLDFMITSKEGGSKRTSRFILLLKHGRSQEEALRGAFGCSVDTFEEAWKEHVLSAYEDVKLDEDQDDEESEKPAEAQDDDAKGSVPLRMGGDSRR
ncbi:MAG: peptidase MA family metallohydrolase [Candidatus Brocadiia bacterium]